ncbi:transposase [Nonomuraea sp. NPDC059007]|uniref:transposase n=1 Tax=Nonomuraea sp. NPDC059007 TaxID=3346692 RepID=UPI0036878719
MMLRIRLRGGVRPWQAIAMARGDLTDDERSLIDPHLPLSERGPIPDLRRQFNAAMWRFRTGSPWRDVPREHGSWSTVYDRFRLWAMAGVFQDLMEAVIAEAAARGQADLGLVSVDSTTARAHHHAAGMALDPNSWRRWRRPPRKSRARPKEHTAPDGGGEHNGEQTARRQVRLRSRARLKAAGLGRSRGGLTSKVHLSADRRCRPLSFVLTPGQAGDSPQCRAVLARIKVPVRAGRLRTRPGAVAADKAYYIGECQIATSAAARITIAGELLEWRPHDFRRIFVTDALRSGLPSHIAAKICGHALLDTTMGYAAICPDDVITHHRAFIARRRAERPQRGIPYSHRPRMGRLPRPLREAESLGRHLRPRVRLTLHP